MNTATSPPDTTQRVQIAVEASHEAVWDALVDGDTTPACYYGFRAEYDLTRVRHHVTA